MLTQDAKSLCTIKPCVNKKIKKKNQQINIRSSRILLSIDEAHTSLQTVQGKPFKMDKWVLYS